MLEWEPTQSDRFFSAALQFIADREGLTKKQLAKISKRTVRTIEYILSLERGAGKETAFALTKGLGYTYPQFLRIGQLIMEGIPGEEALTRSMPPIIAEGDITMPIPGVEGAAEMLTRVPLISFVQAGDWSGVVDNFQPGDAEEWIPFPGHIGPHAFALRVNGPSMEPRFVEGDIIFVDPDREVESGDFIIAKNGADEATFKKFYRDGDRCFLVPLNEDWGKPMEMTGRDWKIVGRVMGKLDLF